MTWALQRLFPELVETHQQARIVELIGMTSRSSTDEFEDCKVPEAVKARLHQLNDMFAEHCLQTYKTEKHF